MNSIVNDPQRPRIDAEQIKQRPKEKRRSSITNPGYVDKKLIYGQNNKDEDENDENQNKNKDDTEDEFDVDEFDVDEFDVAESMLIQDNDLQTQCIANNSEDVEIVSISNMSKSPLNSVCIILNLS